MGVDYARLLGLVSRVLPQARTDGQSSDQRIDRFGNIATSSYSKSGKYGACDEGSYFTFANPVPMTAIAGHVAPVVADYVDATGGTKPMFHLINEATADESKRIYMDYLSIQIAVVNTAATASHWAMETDTGNTRRSSGGTELVEVNPNTASSNTAALTMYAGAVVAAARTSNSRKIGQGSLREVIMVIGDIIHFTFGDDHTTATQMVLAGTTQANIIVTCPPVILGPTGQLLVNLFGPSSNGAPQYHIRGGFWVR